MKTGIMQVEVHT